MESIIYKRGELIGKKYKVHGILGEGGFGTVYLVEFRESGCVYALKTMRSDQFSDEEKRYNFRMEAEHWVRIGSHPCIVRAYFVDEIAGRLYIGMEYIPPGENGINTLEGCLASCPPDLVQSLKWSVQFCSGMEYANSKGLLCHRDIKPENLMIDRHGTIKTTDFGLSLFEGSKDAGMPKQWMKDRRFGSPEYMSPEGFENAEGCDCRSDIYSFGIVLYRMASGGRMPFGAFPPRDDSPDEKKRIWEHWNAIHGNHPIAAIPSPLFPVITRCLEKNPDRRYQDFGELRGDLEAILLRTGGEAVRLPAPEKYRAWELNDIGYSLGRLGRYREAAAYANKALRLDPRLVQAWNNKGNAMLMLGKYKKAISCYRKALLMNNMDMDVIYNLGTAFSSLKRYEDAAHCFKRVVGSDPEHGKAWTGMALCNQARGLFHNAVECYDEAIRIAGNEAALWNGRGISLEGLGYFKEAMLCYEKAVAADPRHADVWVNRGMGFHRLGNFTGAVACYDRAVEIHKDCADAWYKKGNSLYSLELFEEALSCYDAAIETGLRNKDVMINKGAVLARLKRYSDALECYGKALAMDRRDPALWMNKALVEEDAGKVRRARKSYGRFLALAGKDRRFAPHAEHARKRLAEITGRTE